LENLAASNEVNLIGFDELEQILEHLKIGKIEEVRNYFLRQSDF